MSQIRLDRISADAIFSSSAVQCTSFTNEILKIDIFVQVKIILMTNTILSSHSPFFV